MKKKHLLCGISVLVGWMLVVFMTVLATHEKAAVKSSDFDIQDGVLVEYRGSVVPGEVKTIGEGAFMDCSNLTSLAIADSVKLIEEMVFEGCDKLTIYGTKGSEAERYAASEHIPFAVRLPFEEIAPNSYITRIQAAAILQRFISYYNID